MRLKTVGNYLVVSSFLDLISTQLERELQVQNVDLVYWDTRFLLSWNCVFKRPIWSPIRLQTQNYLGTNFAIRKELVTGHLSKSNIQKAIVNLKSDQVRHIPKTLNSKLSAAKMSVEAKLRISEPKARTQEISFVIPTAFAEADAVGQTHLVNLIESLKPLLQNDEVVVVTGTKYDESVLDRVQEIVGDALVHVVDHEEFNYSRRINLGYAFSTKPLLATLNDDVVITDPNTLNRMAEYLTDPRVGQVGIQLRYPNGLIQHAGHKHGPRPKLAYQKLALTKDYFLDLKADREVSGLTGAFTLQKRESFASLGGLCEEFPLGYNDVDYSLKVTSHGQSAVLVNSSHALHFESATRSKRIDKKALAVLTRRWGNLALFEPFTRNEQA